MLASIALTLLLAAPATAPDTFLLSNGDRVSGRLVRTNKQSFVVQTDYGRLTIPRAKVESIRHADGSEERITPPEARAAAPSVHRARLILVILGTPFWQAWDPKDAPADVTLRLDLRLDEEPLATYVDSKPDPKDIPKAVVNTFSLLPGDVTFQPGDGVEVLPPEARPGRVVLKIDVPGEDVGEHRLRMAYQMNSGTTDEPAWKDVVGAETECELKLESPTYLRLKQDAGSMAFSGLFKKSMKNVDSFRLELNPDSEN